MMKCRNSKRKVARNMEMARLREWLRSNNTIRKCSMKICRAIKGKKINLEKNEIVYIHLIFSIFTAKRLIISK